MLLFIIVIFLPLFLTPISKILHVELDFPTGGFTVPFEKPNPKKQSLLTGDFQDNLEKYLKSKIKPRGIFVRLYGQFQYSLFGICKAIVGKEKYFFEEGYITEVVGADSSWDYSLQENQVKLENYLKSLEQVQDKLQKIGKNLIFYTTPSKGRECYEYIPDTYLQNENKNFIHSYDYFQKIVQSSNINYIDSRNFYPQKNEFPIFYKSGIHWSRPLEQKVSCAIVEKMQELANHKIPQIKFNKFENRRKPYKRDDDIQQIANILINSPETYYIYETEIVSEENLKAPKVLLQGGSFGDGLYYDYYEFFHDDFYRLFYDRWYSDTKTVTPIKNGWSQIDFESCLNEIDFVIIEINEAAFNNFSNGFVDYLNSFLDEYISKREK